MAPGGVLTSVDVEAEHQRLARETLTEAGFPPARARLIGGNAADVLPRLTDGGYDLVFCDTRPRDYAGYLVEALRLLRPGGVLALGSVVKGRVADAGARDADSVALRELLAQIRDDERLVPVLLPVDAGLLAAVRR
jgi:predicted O-methyltransferase YrrM